MKVCLPFEPIPEAFHDIWWLIGNFDGLHKGHQALIAAAKAMSLARGNGKIGLLTFEPHPRQYFEPDCEPFRLTPWPRRQEFLQQAGIDIVVVHPFEAPLAQMQAIDFIDNLIKGHCRAAGVVVGESFRFGVQRQGDATLLADRLGAEQVKTIPPVLDAQGRAYSSSRVREALQAGQVDQAAELLGRFWSISGMVEYGLRRGHEIGFPTANINLGDYLRPKLGVYAGVVSHPRLKDHPAAVHIGRRPTLGGDSVHMGVHLIDYDGFLYDEGLTVTLKQFMRQEWEFAGVAALHERIARDISEIRDWFASGVHPAASGRDEV